MPGKVVVPVEYPEVSGPFIFLAGPIQGAPDWQSEAISYLIGRAPELNIASPRRSYLPGTFDYGAQVDWETHHLRHAAANGVILFWLSAEVEHDCGRSYAQTTRFELAEWKVRHERDGARLVIGVEDAFSGARYIRRRFAQDCPAVIIASSLKDTCDQAIELIRGVGTFK